ncbi:mitochondrial fission ELM1 family protein [Marinobacter sp. AL4B]|uniref:mitochondrial fission ELM1 family protein n=1 Tax=Marinobacter sp. AL4B TaxID=2871173 RepID=UPI001CAA68D9|nr:ELM1/GtrOC1 family putative glycosyltransferase [Marinobacter sp. AL4B]MBZ0332615.1 mitochondrial fission ELM1 family protein [Marinobacter sp. AL4B]
MNPETRAPAIWLITDNKPGHKNQLKGLGNRLRVLTGASIHWLNAADYSVPLWRALLGIAPAMDSPPPAPTLVIAAGAGTHRLLLALRRLRKVRTVVLMKPAFPLAWVDAAIIPAHDNVKAGRKTLITEGVINAVTPMAQLTIKPEALILVGGPSPHFDWDDDAVFSQVTDLIARYPEWRWTISDSRRTPAPLTTKLDELQGPKVTFVHHDRSHDNWLNHQLAGSKAVWVTPDSVSMVCEAATSGVPTGLLSLPSRGHSRVAKGVDRLAEQGWVSFWQNRDQVMHEHRERHARLWEADRAARWLINRFANLPKSSNKESLN